MIKKVEIAGKQYPVLFSFNALNDLCEMKNCSFAELEDVFNIENMKPLDVVMLAYVGMKEGARREKKAFKMSMDDVDDLLVSDMSSIHRILGSFQAQKSAPSGNSGALQGRAKKQPNRKK